MRYSALPISRMCAWMPSIPSMGGTAISRLRPRRISAFLKVHRGIPGNAARILRKKYCSSRYP
ncbi:hypothetical protein DIS09_22610 [Burkholderia pseudomallei]|nr:hypothetical protein [Burkholderia pseudomallei]MWJ56130.1 hypothetical protein [Burkholderia pseudomallei]MXP95769.1 hypothetical protein [Burkholderia pseudomallei]MXQ34721.1 hypothetical protein [Burkholderia pseudomallei]NAX16135.1 hypothetical protein [Burkholderia pseudomallei]